MRREASLDDAVTDHTWRRMLDPSAPLVGRVADVRYRMTLD